MNAVRQQAQRSGLVFSTVLPADNDEGHSSSSSSSSGPPRQWQTVEHWPPLPGGSRTGHASVVIHSPDASHTHQPPNQPQEDMVVVVGGDVLNEGPTNSILCLTKNHQNPDTASWSWQPGPAMTQKRFAHAAVVCQGHVYAIGGGNGDEDEDYPTLDTLERIAVNDIWNNSNGSSAAPASGSSTGSWTLLPCRLSSKRCGFAAAVVQDRWIVVAGGYDMRTYLSTVDIVDTQGSTVRVLAGPRP